MSRIALLLLLLMCTTLTGKCATKRVSLKKYRPICSSYPDPPPNGYQRWSDENTWPNKIIPGVGDAVNALVDIPCNTTVILDMSVTIDRLIINGTVIVIDKGPFEIITHYVIVLGKFIIGNESSPYDGKITFTLKNGTYRYGWTLPAGEDDAGDKAFIVLGGLVTMNGMYGNQRAWTKLKRTAKKSDNSITVAGDVSKWPVGGLIVISSTDYDYRQAEKFAITSVRKRSGNTVIGLSGRLKYMHWGGSVATGISGVTMDQSAEVALLNRTIVIRGDKDPENPDFGGQFVVFQTSEAQRIVGIELNHMGQRGIHGKYPLFFYLCQSLSTSIVQKISIHDSNQRCIVLQGTWDLTMDQNVAYNTRGHCFFFEEGLEFGNTLSNNLGISTVKGNSYLPGGVNSTQNDDFPATYWISNPNNTIVNNVAAGCEDTGFWFHFSPNVYGSSRQYPPSRRLYPRHVALKKFEGNVAHSNSRSGLRNWPDGYRPRKYNRNSTKSPLLFPRATAVLKNFMAFKNALSGIYISQSDSITIEGSIFADNRVVAVEIVDAEIIQVNNTVIVGFTENVGNPSGCDDSNTTLSNCEPLSGCRLPVDPSNARSLGVGTIARDTPILGITVSQAAKPSDAYIVSFSQGFYQLPNSFQGVTFSNFDSSCRVAAAFAATGDKRQLFVPNHSSKNITLVGGTLPFYMAPRYRGLSFNQTAVDAGPNSLTYVFRDDDGTLVGKEGGFVVARQRAILPPGKKGCTGISDGEYGYLCPGTCYRQLQFGLTPELYPQFTFASSSGSIVTTIDKASQLLFVNLLSTNVYTVSLDTHPRYLLFSYSDVNGCRDTLTLQFKAPEGRRWEVAHINSATKCTGTGDSCVIEAKTICSSNSLQIKFGGNSLSQVILFYNRKKFVGC